MMGCVMPSAETKHSGVYQLVAVNSAGRVEREVKVTVQGENDVPRGQLPLYPCPSLTVRGRRITAETIKALILESVFRVEILYFLHYNTETAGKIT